ncbi:heat-inducible transcriptional repressor HrcA [Corynebacterium sp. ES2794-CONJ1]|uniref:heat-inducible transcriptional repressor HrcA n=1 Tax=unclassified Corynebacterium TaxID=2624378 RepID=UPI002169EFE3|nr:MULTISPECIES: heat-inducible transcriptional repressor HrcA [unclassified Corynebacterium]MCS4490575.1 heat-inducible transcriptional repressor HrcA [Corynebacterium sp. ES2775-CONJ]MCS4492354.1 heat-inducible transcriptional repressor HrcA [Corynebacterium sp. ES2715-CONJ3]MCS4532454.1 heat-inducible transcriptional repressor HrcA [Corynebacterium sp. ES2730-CONJ]MCU9519849.1 heat-inducible transcriptional repressor HrcA [Corynebacterium sp. ES2794-CONJ1]
MSTLKRRQEVLRAIVADYIRSQEPVGSQALLDRHQLNVSSATIRNDMAALEAEGYIAQQHKSSGRIPTHKGYRLFVDSLHEVKPLNPAERRAISSFLEGAIDLEEVLKRSVHLLAQLTHQVAVVQMPTLKAARVKHLELVTLNPTRLLLVLITDTGRVEQRIVDLDAAIDEDQVARLKYLINSALDGVFLSEAALALSGLMARAEADLSPHLISCVSALVDTFIEHPSDRLILAGTPHLQRFSADFPRVLEALEEQVVVLELLANVQDLGTTSVMIGEETRDDKMREASVVATSYGVGGLGVVGPTHMDYPATMAKVQAVAHYVSKAVINY